MSRVLASQQLKWPEHKNFYFIYLFILFYYSLYTLHQPFSLSNEYIEEQNESKTGKFHEVHLLGESLESYVQVVLRNVPNWTCSWHVLKWVRFQFSACHMQTMIIVNLRAVPARGTMCRIEIEQGLKSHRTNYRSYRGRFLQVI